MLYSVQGSNLWCLFQWRKWRRRKALAGEHGEGTCYVLLGDLVVGFNAFFFTSLSLIFGYYTFFIFTNPFLSSLHEIAIIHISPNASLISACGMTDVTKDVGQEGGLAGGCCWDRAAGEHPLQITVNDVMLDNKG